MFPTHTYVHARNTQKKATNNHNNGINDKNWQFNRCAYVTNCVASIALLLYAYPCVCWKIESPKVIESVYVSVSFWNAFVKWNQYEKKNMSKLVESKKNKKKTWNWSNCNRNEISFSWIVNSVFGVEMNRLKFMMLIVTNKTYEKKMSWNLPQWEWKVFTLYSQLWRST